MLRCAEFCAGIGGFRIGLEESELDVKFVYTNEINDQCEKTYSANFNESFDSKDVFGINVEDLPDFDLLCAGFPCQPFSQAGKCKGFSDERGTIFFKIMEIVKAKKPKIRFFENVPNLQRHDSGKTFQTMKQMLESSDYTVFWDILDSANFGIPQSRPRLYMVCFFNESMEIDEFCFTEKICKKTSLREYLNYGDYSIPISDRWNEYIDLYTNKITEDQVSFELPKTRRHLERIGKNCDLDDCVFQIRSSGIRAYSLDEPFPTFAVSNSGGGAMIPVLSKERRHLNLLEMKRIMGFPDNFDLTCVSRTDAIKQLANAVCPPVIVSICGDIKRAISG